MFIASIGKHKYLEPLIGRDLLVAAFKALSNNIGRNEAHSAFLLTLVKDIYCHLHNRSAYPKQVFASLPFVDKNKLQQFSQKISKEKKDEKTMMAKFKRFLWPILSGSSDQTKEMKEGTVLQQEKTFFEGDADVSMTNGGGGGGNRKGKKKKKGGSGGGNNNKNNNNSQRGGKGGRGGRGGKGGGRGGRGKGGNKGKGKAGKSRRQNMWYNTTDSFDLNSVLKK